MKGNWKWREVCEYKESRFWVSGLKCVGVTVLLSFFFYRSLWAVIPMSIVGYGFWRRERRLQGRAQKEKLLIQFKDLLQTVAVNMRAGYSVENAFLEGYKDMSLMHGDESRICRELKAIRRGLEMNLTLEQLLREFGERSSVYQIQEFASVFGIAKRSGGNISEVIQITVEAIHRKMYLQEEISTQLSGKRMECNIMRVMPFFILWYIESSSPGYFDFLYHNITGICIMTGCLTVYLFAYVVGEKIMEQMVA